MKGEKRRADGEGPDGGGKGGSKEDKKAAKRARKAAKSALLAQVMGARGTAPKPSGDDEISQPRSDTAPPRGAETQADPRGPCRAGGYAEAELDALREYVAACGGGALKPGLARGDLHARLRQERGTEVQRLCRSFGE